jgi:LPXTG-site transpeptidase (sortase) family protein
VLRNNTLSFRAPFFAGTDDLVLNRGVGWIIGTAKPGESGNIGIAGHRDGFFRGLKDILVGDAVELTTAKEQATYIVDQIEIVSPESVEVLQPRGVPSLTLVTCYPFYFVGSAPQRYIVHATLKRSVAAQMPQTTTEKTKGAVTVTTQEMKGEVVCFEGNNVVIKMSTGEVKTFNNVPDTRNVIIDGKEVGVRDLKPGTKLTATITTTTTPVTVRTTTVGSGRVWYVSGNNVILTLPNGENRQYKVARDYKFTIEGKPASVYELRKGMTVSAEKIVEEPKVEIASGTRIVGEAPPPPPPKAAAAPAPAPVAAPAAAKALPKTGSPVPLMGLLGLMFVGGSYGIRMLRRS